MASYIQVPRDLSKVKTKVLFGLTKRQLICFAGAALTGVPLFFSLKLTGGNTAAMTGMVFIMVPFFLLAMYEKDGRPLEKVLWLFIQSCFLRPRERPYRQVNYYELLEKQAKLNEEVEAIVYGNKETVPEG